MAAAAKSFKQLKLDLLNANILCTNVALMGGGYRGNIFFYEQKKIEKRIIENVPKVYFS